MKHEKIGTYIVILLICSAVFVLGFSYENPTQPYTFYQVYLDGELLGTINSKQELENYIDSQGSVIKENVLEYQQKLEVIDEVNETISGISNEEIDNLNKLDKVNYLIKHQSDFNISDIKIEYLNKYLDNDINSLSEDEISEMRDYVDKNIIYLSAEKVYTPNGIVIKKSKHIKMKQSVCLICI